jgi:hypothetical protein
MTLMLIYLRIDIFKRTCQISSGEKGEDRNHNDGAEEVVLHSPFSWIKGIFEGHNQIMAQAEVEGE